LPREVARKILEGLVRNAVENTPDGGEVLVEVATGPGGKTVLTVEDKGVGLTAESQSLLFKGPFIARETLLYSSRRPYDFNAGGKGLDLLRMKVFSERYGFHIELRSRRCLHIPSEEDVCPGDVRECVPLRTSGESSCLGGTKVTVEFPPAEALFRKE
jgi:signal transduction histidine kinase